MVDYVIYKYNHGFGMSWPQVCQLARDVASVMAATLPDNDARRGQLQRFHASHRWLKGFKRRHGDLLTSRRAQLFHPERAAACRESVVVEWVNVYLEALAEVDRLSGGEGKWENVTPQQISNMDESGFTAHPARAGEVAAPAGHRECQKIGSEHGLHVTGVYVLGADGRCSEPFFILPGKVAVRKQLEPDLSLKGVEDGKAYAFAEKGNMTSEVRFVWI